MKRKAGRKKLAGPNPVDLHIGSRLRDRRRFNGLSQKDLGESVGLTFQQVQKYEVGQSRITSSTLYVFANFLRVPISYFFDEYDPNAGNEFCLQSDGSSSVSAGSTENAAETGKLLRAYCRIKDQNLRDSIRQLVASVGDITDRPQFMATDVGQ